MSESPQLDVPPRLHVNVDHCATLRQARGTRYPDPVWAAVQCELAGADGITVHLREDRRHIQDRDVRILRETVNTVLNLEMAATSEMVAIAQQIKPDLVTLVPEKRQERTTEGGLNLDVAGLADVVARLRESDIVVSLFVDPEPGMSEAATRLGAQIVELHTGDYCVAQRGHRDGELQRLASAATAARAAGLRVAAGHGLDYPNVRPVAAIAEIEELNIGHAIMARALFCGLDEAVREMLASLR